MVAHSDNMSLCFGYILKAEATEYSGVLAVDCGKKESQRKTQIFF